MKREFLLIIIIMVTTFSYSQEPFDIPTIDYATYKTIDFRNTYIGSQTIKNSSDIKNQPVVFTQQNLNFSIDGNSDYFLPSANLNLIKYRLRVYTTTAKKTKKNYNVGDTIRFYIPLIILSNLSINYDSLNVTSLLDATGFVGSPFTFRIMPSYDIKIGLENTLTFGHISDLRTVLISDSITNSLKAEFGYYGALGIKYSGKGEVRDESGLKHEGNWSVSCLAYMFYGTDYSKDYLFKEDKNNLSGLEFIFKFKLIDTKLTRFNLSASAKYQFENINDISPFIFKIGIGN